MRPANYAVGKLLTVVSPTVVCIMEFIEIEFMAEE